MNILLWALQAALAVLSLAGGAYKVLQFDELSVQESPNPLCVDANLP